MDMHQTNQLTHAGSVVFKRISGDLYFLIISSSDSTTWVLPKGHIEVNEKAEDAATRELREETGILGEVVQILDRQYLNLHGESSVVQYFLVEATGEAQADETRSVRWLKPDEAVRLLSFEDTREILKKAIELIS